MIEVLFSSPVSGVVLRGRQGNGANKKRERSPSSERGWSKRWEMLPLLVIASFIIRGCESCDCGLGEFPCAAHPTDNCTCIPERWRCDSDDDCGNGRDEIGCDSPSCSSEHFTCANRRCILKTWWCDGDDDCGEFSDEYDCAPRNCTTEEFSCNNGRCIRQEWQCDGDDDCSDSSDENCPSRICGETEFSCADGSCITLTWKCDHDVDCQDGSDEDGCTQLEPLSAITCPVEQFRCTNGRCISASYRCDSDNDCGDWSDEDHDCEGKVECRHEEFRCQDGMCINQGWKCDGDSDCDDGSDENDCPATVCSIEQFQCKLGRCIRKMWRCDGDVDCSDNSDEEGCGPGGECTSGQFKCEDGSCIGQHLVCDGQPDCPDGSDETTNKTCKNGSPCRDDGFPCQHLCLATPVGGQQRCACKEGYELAPDGRSCLDVNECRRVDICSHRCINTVPGYQCQCVKGYRLRADKKRCKAQGPEPYLVFANRGDIRRVSLTRSEYTAVLSGLHNAIAVDFHYNLGLVFWSDITSSAIYRAYLNGSRTQEVVAVGLTSPGGLAIDWVSNKIFWSDAGMSRIELAHLDGTMRKVLVWKDVEKPRAIVANPEKATICWTDWGSKPRIDCIFQDGSSRFTVADSSLFWPNGLTIDYPRQQLFWVDAKLHIIETAFLDGTGRRRVIEQGLPHPFAITVFEDTLFWTDWKTKSIHSANKITGQNQSTVHNRLHFPMDIKVLHPLRQPEVKNRCEEGKHGCSHLCLPNNVSFSCVCPTGFRLSPDSKTCQENVNIFLLFTRRSDIRRLCLECDNDIDMVVPLHNISSAVALDFDGATDTIYWSDVTNDTISRAKWDGTKQEPVIDTNLESPAGLAVDWAGRKLYWVDAGTDRLEVSNLDGTLRSILIWQNLDRPRDIVVDPNGGYMYWTECGVQAMIEKAWMDGTHRITLVHNNLTWPNGLAIDYEQERIYWTDSGTKTIESSGLDGQNRQVLLNTDLPYPFGIAVYGDLMYWTDWKHRSIECASKNLGQDKRTIIAGLDSLMDLHVFHRRKKPKENKCSTKNGGCSHLCLIAPAPADYSCACPTGITLNSNGQTCSTDMKNFLIVTRRTDIRTLSLDMPYLIDVILPVHDLENVIAIDVDTKNDKIYWSDSARDKIQRSDTDGSNVETVLTTGLDTVDGLAVDSIGQKFYWTDTGRKRIEVYDFRGHHRKVLIWENLDSPRSIVLHYDSGYMYWTDWGNKPRIERADMDGYNQVTVVGEELGWPNGLTIDSHSSLLVWADAKSNVIEASDFNGNDRRVLVRDVPHPYGLAVTSEHIYWTDWEVRAIRRTDKGKRERVETIRGNLAGLMDIHAIHKDDSSENVCGDDNGGCSHLCLRKPGGHMCACPTGLRIREDQKTCQDSPLSYLLFVSRGSVRRISLDTPDNTDVFLPIPDVYNLVGVDFLYSMGKIFYTDVRLDVIRRANTDGSNIETIVDKDLTTAGGLAVDWVAHNLYWTDTGRNIIEVARVDGSSRKSLIDLDLDEPRAITVFPQLGLVFWSDWGSLPKIERAYLDGSSRRVIVATELGWPNGLTLDYDADRLYWADAHYDRIETSDLSGKNRIQLVQDVAHPFGLTQLGQYLYWTDWQTKSIERAEKETGKHLFTVQSNIDYLMEIKAVAAERQGGGNPCGLQNGGCSHLCLYRAQGYICACPTYPDPNPCSTIPSAIEPPTTSTEKTEEDEESAYAANISVRCTAADVEDGKCHYIGFSLADPALQTAYIVATTVLLALAVLLSIALLIWKRKRRGQGIDPTLTFSNPTYSTSSGDMSFDKKSWGWTRHLRYDKNEEKIFRVTAEDRLNNLEVAALVSKRLSNLEVDNLAPPPPIRIDSKQDYYYLSDSPSEQGQPDPRLASPSKLSDGSQEAAHPCVETDI